MIRIVDSFPLELMKKSHDFVNDTFKFALFEEVAALDGDTTAYSTTGEVTAAGYTAGGVTLTAATGYPKLEAINGINHACMRWDTSVAWTLTETISDFRYGLIYNDTSTGNLACVVLDFTCGFAVASGPLTIQFPLANRPIINIRPGQGNA